MAIVSESGLAGASFVHAGLMCGACGGRCFMRDFLAAGVEGFSCVRCGSFFAADLLLTVGNGRDISLKSRGFPYEN